MAHLPALYVGRGLRVGKGRVWRGDEMDCGGRMRPAWGPGLDLVNDGWNGISRHWGCPSKGKETSTVALHEGWSAGVRVGVPRPPDGIDSGKHSSVITMILKACPSDYSKLQTPALRKEEAAVQSTRGPGGDLPAAAPQPQGFA